MGKGLEVMRKRKGKISIQLGLEGLKKRFVIFKYLQASV